jgi:hypothetical protein
VRAAARLAGDLFPCFLIPLGRPAAVGGRELCWISQPCVLFVLAGGEDMSLSLESELRQTAVEVGGS